jgi:hypothetical protein
MKIDLFQKHRNSNKLGPKSWLWLDMFTGSARKSFFNQFYRAKGRLFSNPVRINVNSAQYSLPLLALFSGLVVCDLQTNSTYH